MDFANTIRDMEDRIIRSMGIPANVFTSNGGNYAAHAASIPPRPTIQFDPLLSMPIIVSPYNCSLAFDRWKRWPKSRRKRIRRKWQKRYGCVMKCVQDKVYQMGGRFLACPHMAEKLKQACSPTTSK